MSSFKSPEVNVNKLSQIFAVILALSVVGACNPQPQEIKVRLSSVEETTIESSEFVGTLESLCSPTLKPLVSGRVNKIFVELGDRVTAETPLIQLISTQQNSSDQLFISAPCTGIISDILVSERESVSTSTSLITLVQIQPLEITLSVPLERGADRVELGMPVELIDEDGQNVESLTITSISPSVMTDTQSILVKARFDNAKGQFRPGQLVRARLIWGEQRRGFLIPTSAVTRVAGQTYVFVAQSRGESQFVAQQKAVELGDIQDGNYQVISGLQAGEKLITSSILNLSDGTAVTPEQ